MGCNVIFRRIGDNVNRDFFTGWDAARAVWQKTGSVPPYPPEMEAQRTKEANRPPVEPKPKKARSNAKPKKAEV